ncbi:MAG: hypothetical protein ACOVSS_08245 [Bacteroidia bacterium]
MRKLLLLTFTLALVQWAEAQLYYTSGTFRVVSATRQTLYPGVQGAPISDNYIIDIVFKRSTAFMADTGWVEGRADRLELAYTDGRPFTGTVKKGERLRIILRLYTPTADASQPGFDPGPGSPQRPPFLSHRGKLLFRYGFSDLRYGFSIMQVVKKESVYAP